MEEQEQEYERLSGTVEAVTFRNEQNGYTVLDLIAGEEFVTVVGILPTVATGDELSLAGGWENHRAYGRQFHAVMCEQTRPATSEAILKYLSSGAVKGIGPATACKVVELFGDKTLEVLEQEPERLSQIKGISKAKALKIGEEYARMFGVREVMLRLAPYAVTPPEALNIFKAYGSTAVDLVCENPYRLCSPSIGFSFERADAIARQLGIKADSRYRVQSGILHVLRHNLGNGHTCLPRAKLLGVACTLLDVDEDAAEMALDDLLAGEELVSHTFEGEEYLFLPWLYRAEHYTASRLQLLLQFPPRSGVVLEDEIDRIEKEQGIEYEERQRQAIRAAVEQGLLILTGGPGTGKTTTLKAIIDIMSRQELKIALAAPTGRAAKRLQELTGYEAKTIHRLLEVEFTDNERSQFGRNEKNPLDCDAVIVDELSMVDSLLFESLLRAMRLGCRLILVGDADQLPSVGAGNVLGDLLAAGCLPQVQLTRIFRQSMQSLIVTNAHRIVAGEMPELGRKDGDFFLLTEHNPVRAARLVAELVAERLPRAYGFSPLHDIQLLCPSRKMELGTASMNQRLQQMLNPPGPGKGECRRGGALLRVGDKVMQMKNNYDILWTKDNGEDGSGVFNGDIGILLAADLRTGTLSVRYDDRVALYTEADAQDLELAYAATVHKSQGSEYTCVVLPVIGAPPQLCYRNLLYTAVTRAKKLLVMVGSAGAVAGMVQNNKRTLRYTALARLLGERSDG